MLLRRLKTEEITALKLGGVMIEPRIEDGNLKELVLRDGKTEIRVKIPGSYSDTLHVLVPDRPRKKVFTLKGTIGEGDSAVELETDFDTRKAAEDRRAALDLEYRRSNLEIEEHEIEAEDGKVAGDDSLPF